MATHLSHPIDGGAVCGVGVMPSMSSDPDAVTCGRCERSPIYASAVRGREVKQAQERLAQDRHAQEVLDIVGEIAADIAEGNGYCSTFDEVIEEINSRLPRGLTIPPRSREFEVEVEMVAEVRWYQTVSVEAASHEEACRKVEDDPESFVDTTISDWRPRDGYSQSVDYTVESTTEA